MSGIAEGWYVLTVRSNCEKSVAKKLQERGFEALCPTRKTLRQWKDRKKKVDEVLFRNYVFVQTDLKRKNEVFYDPNVIRYLHIGSEVARLTEQEVETLRRIASLTEPDSVKVDYSRFEPGEEVEISSGPLRGLMAEVVESDKNTLRLAIPSLQTSLYVKTNALELQKKL